MKHIISILLLISLFTASRTVFATSPNDHKLITGLNVFDADTTFRYVYLYSDGKKVLETKYFKQDDSWVSISQTEWVYKSGMCTDQIERIWKSNEWQDTYRINFVYKNGVLESETHHNYSNKIAKPLRLINYLYNAAVLTSKNEYSNSSNGWSLSTQTDFKYFGNNQIDSTLITVYETGIVTNQYLMKNFYNPEGTLNSQLHKERVNGNNQWVNTQQINWFYKNNTTQVLSQRVKKWLPEVSLWENSQRIDYDYDASNNLITETCQYWKMMFWESDLRYDYIYDSQGNQTKKILSKPIYHSWRALISINYSDFSGNKANHVESQYEFWGGNTGELVTSFIPFNFNNETAIQKGKSLQVIYNDTLSSLPVTHETFRSIPVFPNPSDGIFYINPYEYDIQSWIISDISGRVLRKKLQTISSGVIDITDLPKGIYILKVNTSSGRYTQKLFKN